MKYLVGLVAFLTLIYFGVASAGGDGGMQEPSEKEVKAVKELKKATFAGGCFWCTEAVFQEVQGVYKVTSGYIGGEVENPTYKQICTGQTGHAEATEIQYNPEEVDFLTLLEIHLKTHDPTTLNRQGNDVGTQYRSAVFFHDEKQEQQTKDVIAALTLEKVYSDRIVTEVTAATKFYPAEDYHQDYYANNPRAGYCQMVVTPKVEKFRKVFADKLRKKPGQTSSTP